MNEILRRALFRAHLAEEDVAAQLGVDPKTVRRWLEGRVPYPRHRWALSDLLDTDETDLWPEIHAARAARSRPQEVQAVYPNRWSVPREVWHRLFDSAQQEIGVIAYSALFLAEDAELLSVFRRRANAGISLRIALGDPDSPQVAERGAEEGIGEAMAAKIRNALALYIPLLDAGSAEIRIHRTTLYNSLYRADNDMLVNQHTYGIPAASAPVFHLRKASEGGMFAGYADSWERIWLSASPLA